MNRSDAPPDDAGRPADTDETADEAAAAPPRRRVRSFVTRAGRLSNAQRRALDELGPRLLLPFADAPLDWTATFGRAAARIVEIGFGMGTTTAEIAAARPQDDFVGIEVHEPGVGALLKLLDERGLTNVRAIQHDAVDVIGTMIEAGSLDGVHVFFPDPWHKKRHHKRRLLQPPFAALLASRLKPGGYLHCATDWQDYAEQMLAVLSAEPLLVNAGADGYAPRPDYRPVTKFEQRGLKLGHGVWDLLFRRRTTAP